MCLAIFSEGSPVPEAHLIAGMESNPHGAGIAYADGQSLIVEKGFWTMKALNKALRRAEGLPFMVHFRYATHGTINDKNCHPFWAGNDFAMCHNGILDWRSTKTASDTACFVNDFLSHNVERVFEETGFADCLETMIGAGNKMILLSATGESIILNENMGIWEDGIWYSNSGYLPMTRWPAWRKPAVKDECEFGF